MGKKNGDDINDQPQIERLFVGSTAVAKFL
jgi:hypothetical protein